MKKILALSLTMMLLCSCAFAGKRRGITKVRGEAESSFQEQNYRNYQEIMRQHREASRTIVKDYQNKMNSMVTTYKKSTQTKSQPSGQGVQVGQGNIEQRSNEINYQIRLINEEIEAIEKNPNMSITEKTIRKRILKKKIEDYNKQREELE